MRKHHVLLVACCAALAASADVTADFTQTAAKFRPTARVLSFEKNLEPVTVEVKDGKFILAKPDAYSAAFLVTFDL